MNLPALVIILIGMLSGAFPAPANAVLVFFTDRTAWQTAAGPSSFTENFQGFAVDTSFRTAPLTLTGMTISQGGTNAAFRNLIEVPPFQFTDNNGTSHASLFTNAAEGGSPGTQVRFTFAALNAAFGGESTGGTGGEGAVFEVFNGATLLGSQILGSTDNAFLGYVLTGGDVATSVRFRSATLIAGTTGEGFGYDNLAGVNAGPIPEPGTWIAGVATLCVLARGVFRRTGIAG